MFNESRGWFLLDPSHLAQEQQNSLMRTAVALRVLVLSVRTHLEKKERHSGRDRTSGTLFTLSSITYVSAKLLCRGRLFPLHCACVESAGVRRWCAGWW